MHKNNILSVWHKNTEQDALAKDLKHQIKDLGISIKHLDISIFDLYKINGTVSKIILNKIAKYILTDYVIQNYSINAKQTASKKSKIIDVFLKKGVTDVVGEALQNAVYDIGILQKIDISTGKRYVLTSPDISHQIADEVAKKLLSNSIINDYFHGK
jgi:phosphoribosylformylglycinamidine (FGAM) synthase PurS component